MHPSTPAIAADVRGRPELSDKLDALADRYSGATCVVVTCGPSLADVPVEEFRRRLPGVLTIVVKQGIDVVREQADFHCWNSFNVARFRQPSSDTIRCFVSEPTGRIIQHNRHDLRFPLAPAEGDLSTSLAASHDFDRHRLNTTLLRPFGPGIMYELCFYLAVHLGVGEIITVGWDIANPAGKNTHFYDRSHDEQFFESERDVAAAMPHNATRRRVPERVRRPVRWVRTRVAHQRGEVYNRTRVLPGETDLVAGSTGPLAAWLGECGVGLTVTTDSPYLAEGIPRLSVDGLMDRLGELRS